MNMGDRLTILQGDALTVLKTLPDESVQCCVTSPPYYSLRDYGVEGQIGLEETVEEYIEKLVIVFREVKRVLRADGTLWCNMGDCYSAQAGQRKSTDARGPKQCTNRGSSDLGSRAIEGLKPKDLVGVPWMLAFALRSDGWWLRQDIIWHKPNPMPESITDRCTKAHEYIFLLTKSARYFFDQEAIKQPITESSIERLCQYVEGQQGSNRVPGKTNGNMKAVRFGGNKLCPDTRLQSGNEWNPPVEGTLANKRSVWTVPTAVFSEAHFATFPPDLIKPCILAGTSARGCCPKCGAPWERVVETVRVKDETRHTGRAAVGCEDRQDSDWPRMISDSKTTGWEPGCDCSVVNDHIAEDQNGHVSPLEPVPCTVLDPFFGSGTTGMVALELGRKCIGIELNPAYIKLAEQRCHVTPGLALA